MTIGKTSFDGSNDQIDRWTVLVATVALLTLLGVGVLAVASTYSTREGRTLSGEWRPNPDKVGALMELFSLRSH
jgi:hypothetical protein